MSGDGSGSVLPEVDFSFAVDGVSARAAVARVHLTEALSTPYECVVELAWEADEAPAGDSLMGRRATLTMARGGHRRRVHGVVVGVCRRAVTAGHRVDEVVVVPALWLLGQRSEYRIFQDVDALTIVKAVLFDAGLYETTLREVLGRVPPAPREYCVQHGETDLDFVARLLSEEGLHYAFAQGDDDEEETLLVLDGEEVKGFDAVATMDGLPVHVDGGAATADAERVVRLEDRLELSTAGWHGRDYDFTHPQASLEARHPSVEPDLLATEYPARFVLGRWDDSAHAYRRPENLRRYAVVRQDALQASSAGLRGDGVVLGFTPGAVVELQEPVPGAGPTKVLLTRVVHLASAPDVTHGGSAPGGAGEDRYVNHFEAVPEALVQRPRVRPKPPALSPQSAVVVVASEGSTEEIVTDHYGRVLVRFHWDRPAQRTGAQAKTAASCWLRVAQGWAGGGWGSLFTPRVGMEVIVHFLDGDIDRPFVAGCLYNHANEPPFALPEHRTRSVIRTQTSPRNGGYNELRFEDLAQHEEVYLRAQRDLREHVLHDHTRKVDRDEGTQVGRDSSTAVKRDRSVTVDGAETHVVKKNRHRETGGNDLTQVVGNRSVVVHGANSEHANETHRFTADEGAVVEVGGGSGSSVQMIPDEMQVVVPKVLGVAVGDDGMKLVVEAEGVVWEVPKKFTLKVGDTRVEVTTDKITLKTGGAKIELNGDKITVSADGDVEVKGSKVKING